MIQNFGFHGQSTWQRIPAVSDTWKPIPMVNTIPGINIDLENSQQI